MHPGGKFMAASLAINCDNANQQELKEMRRRRYRASWNGPPLSAIAYWHLSHTNTHTSTQTHITTENTYNHITLTADTSTETHMPKQTHKQDNSQMYAEVKKTFSS